MSKEDASPACSTSTPAKRNRDPVEWRETVRRAGRIKIQRRYPLRPQIRYRTDREIAGPAKRKMTLMERYGSLHVGDAAKNENYPLSQAPMVVSPWVCDESGTLTRTVMPDVKNAPDMTREAVKQKVLEAEKRKVLEAEKRKALEVERLKVVEANLEKRNSKSLARLKRWIKNRESQSGEARA